MEDCAGLLALAQSLGIQVVGVAFHVGSGATNPQAFADAIAAARQVGSAHCMCCCCTACENWLLLPVAELSVVCLLCQSSSVVCMSTLLYACQRYYIKLATIKFLQTGHWQPPASA